MKLRNGETPQCVNTNGVSVSVTVCKETNMDIVARSDLNFQGKALVPVSNITGVWLTSSDLAKALEYSNSRAVTMIYNKYADEFTSGMTQVLEVSTSGNYRKKVRVFSLRGAHLIAMFARTNVAKKFRRWVLDILDREGVERTEISPPSRYLVTVTIRDNIFGGGIEFFGKGNDMNSMATGICRTMGFEPSGFSRIPMDMERIRRVN
ncbi:BRO family, N-terminal domain [Edwardsiella tarda]|nr:BRO family, N-terminal domain [Edwardsiella tarda]